MNQEQEIMEEKIIKIKDELIEEALYYARLSKNHLSNQHSFHKGSLDDKEYKMFQGKLGEKIFKQYMLDNDIIRLQQKLDTVIELREQKNEQVVDDD